MSNIYQIQKEYLEIAEYLTENGGELNPAIEELLKINAEQLQVKVSNYGYVIKQLEGDALLIDEEIKRLQALKKQRTGAIERLGSIIKSAMELYQIEEIKTATIKLSFRKSESVEVIDAEIVPDKYKSATITISKKDIKEDLKAGIEVPGAYLITNNNLQIK